MEKPMGGPFRQILVALDGSRLAESSLPVATTLASKSRGSVLLFHALEISAPATVHGDRHIQTESEGEDYLSRVARRITSADLTVDVKLVPAVEGKVAATIATTAEVLEVDLVVVTTHGAGGIRDFLFGRVAQQVVHQTRKPLVVVPSSEPVRPFRLGRIVVPLDGGAEAEIVLPLVQRLTAASAVAITLVRVVPTSTTLHGAEAAVGTLLPAATARMLDFEEEEASRYLVNVAEEWFTEREVDREVRRGQVAEEIEKAVAEADADLVVMSTRGRTGVSAILEKNVGRRLISAKASPVLLVRSSDGIREA